MRTLYIQCKDRRTAVRRCPWASMIVKVEGGYMAWESYHDYLTWRAQK